MRDRLEVHEAAIRVIRSLEFIGYDAQRDMLLVYSEYNKAIRLLAEAGIVHVDTPACDDGVEVNA